MFDEFLDRALPVVFGYLLRLGGGDREQLLERGDARGERREVIELSTLAVEHSELPGRWVLSQEVRRERR